MRMYDIIAKKRDKHELTKAEIDFFIKGYTNGDIPDYQASALLMAIYINGMTDDELTNLTVAMAESGDQADLSGIDGITADKHSTGGVGDKTTLIIAPVVASLGCKVAKMSGRGLGHSGGTVDKLEAIPGFNTELSPDKFINCVNSVGVCIAAHSGNLVPADKKLYALRDVTATVSSIPLIASSIMSKKLASGSKCILLDIKTGSGAFIKNLSDSEKIARIMTAIGKNAGRKTAAVITNMDIPLGNAVGNSLEVIEAVKVLKGELRGDLYDVCIELAANMVNLATEKPIEECRQLAENAIADGSAFTKFKEMVSAQGGDTKPIDDPELFGKAKIAQPIISSSSGYIGQMNTEKIGTASVILGAGRTKKDDCIDLSAGIVLHKKTGDFVNAGDEIATLYTNNIKSINDAEKLFTSAVSLAENKPDEQPLIFKIIY